MLNPVLLRTSLADSQLPALSVAAAYMVRSSASSWTMNLIS
jgi:hypothetical protein